MTRNLAAARAAFPGLLLLAPSLAFAQARPLLEPPEFVLAQWTTAEGLPQNSVTSIVQTPDGYLWLGTFGGLARFDGSTFRMVRRADSAGSHTDRILSLAVAPDSAIWIGTEAGLLRYHGDKFEVYDVARGLPDDEVSAVHVDRDGILWIGTARGGVARRVAGSFVRVLAADGRPVPQVINFVESADGTLWLNFANGMASIAARSRDVVRMESLGAPPRPMMVQDAGGGSWRGTANDGLFFVEPGKPRESLRQYALPDGNNRYRVRSLFADREGNVWVGTDANGLLLAQRNLFTTYTTTHGLSHSVMTAVMATSDGTMWAATNCGGLNAIDARQGTVRTFKPRKPNDPTGDPCVFALAETPKGTLWAGTWGGGLTRIRNGVEERVGLAGLRDSVVLALFADRDQSLWVGTNSGGLAHVRDDRVVATFTTANGLPHNSVRTIYQARSGDIWVGTLGGLARLTNGRVTSFGAAEGLSALHVRAIHEDRDGNLWIGTYGGGINRLRDGQFSAIRQGDGLAEDVVSSILEDEQDGLWTSGNLGIARIARTELLDFAEGRTRRVRSVLYGVTDGLLLAETNGGFQPSAWKDARGRHWYPTVRGLAVIDPARAIARDASPLVAIEHVVVNGQERPVSAALDVGPGRTNLEFRYTGLSLSAPRHLRFRYRLLNFDDEWVDAGARRVAYYPRLPMGRYTFIVAAANRGGVWNEQTAELPVRVAGTLWSSWPFRLAMALALVVVVALVAWRRSLTAHRWRSAQEDFSRRLIESQEHERKRVAAELHDSLGQELLVIRNRALMGLRGEAAPAVRDQLEAISAVAAQSLDGVRGLAHNLTPYQLDHLGLSAALRAMLTAAAATVDSAFEIVVEDIDDLLPKEGEINLYRVVQEAVNNVVRHSRAASAGVHARRSGTAIRVTIRDDGAGFHVRHDGTGRLAGGFGLSGMAERARILDARLDVISAPGQGTRLELWVPVRTAAAAPEGARR